MSIFLNHIGLGDSKRRISSSRYTVSSLPFPYGELGCSISDSELRETAYEIFVYSCRSSSGKPLNFSSHSEKLDRSSSSLASFSRIPSSQRSLTATAASKMKKALGLKSYSPNKSPSKELSPLKSKKPITVGDLMRIQMQISEQTDSRIHRALLRVAAGQLGKPIESIVLPLELLQQLKLSDFSDMQEYETWQVRNLKILEAGLLLHPRISLTKSDSSSAQQLQQIIRGAAVTPIETGKNSEQMQSLRSSVISLAFRSVNGINSDICHWADGFPLNLRLYHMLLDACFDKSDETSIIDDIEDLTEVIKRTWGVLGINQMLHNLCFTWILFDCFVATGQAENHLLVLANNQLAEIAKDVKSIKDLEYTKILSTTLSSILSWLEKRLLAYHETFHHDNIDSMTNIVSLCVSVAKILVEDNVSGEYQRMKREVDVACNKVDTYIRSSIHAAFLQKMEKADSSRQSSNVNPKPSPVLAILAQDIIDLANKEKYVFSPILKRWHPLAAGVAVATLHTCYRNEFKQFVSGLMNLTPESILVLKAADKLEKELVQIAVEDSVDSDDGGKAIILEMIPYEAESTIFNLTKAWIKDREDKIKDWIDRSVQQEAWDPKGNKERVASSAIEILRTIDETLMAFFELPIPMHQLLVPDLMIGIDKNMQHYISQAKSGCGTRNTFIPSLPALTRCTAVSKFQGVWKKKEKQHHLEKRKSQVGSLNGDNFFGLLQLCVRLNTLQHIKTELENLENRAITYYRNSESSNGDISNGMVTKFQLSLTSCQEGIQYLCEAIAYKVVFHDLSHVLWDGLYVGNPASSRIEPFCKELNLILEKITSTVHLRVRNRVITATMKATFDGFLLVLLSGGPSRAFTCNDYKVVEEDFEILKDLFLADGDGLPEELVEKGSAPARNILSLFKLDTEILIERFKETIFKTHGPTSKSKLPLPLTSGHWNPTDANTLLHVLCHRNDETASKFLKKTYHLPKKLS